ncbi:MAG: hypothetical protein AABW85_04930, partial [archaeon]
TIFKACGKKLQILLKAFIIFSKKVTLLRKSKVSKCLQNNFLSSHLSNIKTFLLYHAINAFILQLYHLISIKLDIKCSQIYSKLLIFLNVFMAVCYMQRAIKSSIISALCHRLQTNLFVFSVKRGKFPKGFSSIDQWSQAALKETGSFCALKPVLLITRCRYLCFAVHKTKPQSQSFFEKLTIALIDFCGVILS